MRIWMMTNLKCNASVSFEADTHFVDRHIMSVTTHTAHQPKQKTRQYSTRR
jgi:hypothetical protein